MSDESEIVAVSVEVMIINGKGRESTLTRLITPDMTYRFTDGEFQDNTANPREEDFRKVVKRYLRGIEDDLYSDPEVGRVLEYRVVPVRRRD